MEILLGIIAFGIIWVVTTQKINLKTGVNTPETTLIETTNETKARLLAKKAVSLEPNGETTDYIKEENTEVWLTESGDPLYDTTVVMLEKKD